jgi:hypothetical protein
MSIILASLFGERGQLGICLCKSNADRFRNSLKIWLENKLPRWVDKIRLQI